MYFVIMQLNVSNIAETSYVNIYINQFKFKKKNVKVSYIKLLLGGTHILL